MADSLIFTTELKTLPKGSADATASSSLCSLFHRRIDFHPAKKPFSGFSNGSGEFKMETLNPSSESQGQPASNTVQSTSTGKKLDRSDILENGLDPEISFGITFRRIGAGLENLGNTCFLNSVLQCLTYTEPLAAYLQSGKHQISCRTSGFCALCAIQKHVSRALQSTGRILAPKDLVSNLRCISRNFRNARQEDAHEYMVNLLESMHRCCLPSGVPTESPSAYDRSLVHKIFGGRLRSQVKCMQCSYCSNKFDPFLDLSLEIVKADSLQKALAHFTATEQLDGGERQYHCQRCKQKVRALKQLTVQKAPYVLAIHLKRFNAYVPGEKIDKKVHFGPTLDLKPFVSGPCEGDLRYTLYGVLVHAGWSTRSGHYYCFVRTSSGMWYSLDDNRVVQVSERTVLDQKAYMLFYVRDRKNISIKKVVDVVQKQSTFSHVVGNNTSCTSNHSQKEAVLQNGSIDKKISTADGPVTSTQKDSLYGGSPIVTQVKDPVLKSSVKVPSSKEPVKGPSLKVSEVTSAVVTTAVSVEDPKKELNFLASHLENSKHDKDGVCSVKVSQLDLPSGKDGNISNNSVATVSVDLLTSSKLMNGSLSERALKCRVAKMNVGTKILFGGFLSLRRKKKDRSKRSAMALKNLARECLLAEGLASTSEETRKVSTDSARTKKKHGRSNSKKGANGGEKLMNKMDGEFRKRIEQDSAELATDEQQLKISCIGSTAERAGDSLKVHKIDSQQDGFISMLTRGLEDAIVTRWDGTELPSSHLLGSSGMERVIGYVPDEWDEEYDRGKRKKVRSGKTGCGGPNPFQEIATMKAQLKKPKMDQSSSANRPFRI